MIRKTESGLLVESQTTSVEFKNGQIVSIRSKVSGEEFIDPGLRSDEPGFELLHQNGSVSPLGRQPLAMQVTYKILTERIAEMVVSDWECDVSTRIAIDEDTGDILVEPSVWTMQGGVAGVGMNVTGIRDDLFVVGPFQQGVRMKMSNPQMKGKFALWPNEWEAGFLVFDGGGSGFSIQTWDERFIFKGIKVGTPKSDHTAQFITFAAGPLEMNRCAGNLCWRISAYQGDWTVPVMHYRNWYWNAYRLDQAAKLRPAWSEDIKLAVSWCPTEPDLLDALAKQIDPKSVYLHVPHWRAYEYDQDYPSFVPSEEGKTFLLKARAMGFHAAPHTNTCQMNPDHPFFFEARDFCTRSPMDMRWGGWTWMPVEGWGNYGPPQSYSQIAAHKDWNVLVNVHLAWSPWRRQLTQQVAGLIQDLNLDSVFVDVSQHIHNSDNAQLEGLSYAEGSLKLIRELSELAPQFCVSGEGRNEISTQFLSMVQFHLYKFAHMHAIDGEDVSWVVEGTVPVNEILFKGLTRGIGYNYGKGENRRYMVEATLKQGAIPTLIFKSNDPVSELANEECRYLIEHAHG